MEDREGITRILGAVAAVFWILFAVFLVIRVTAGDGDYLAWQMERHAPSETTGLPEKEYGGMGNMIADYLTGKTDEFQYAMTDEAGGSVSCFHKDEAAHMADCRKLIRSDEAMAITVGIVALLVTLLAVILNHFFISYFFRGLMIGLRVMIIAAVLFGLWAAVNFDGLFVTFHKIAFPNGGWRFDPRESMLIRLMPIEFFTDLGIRGALQALSMPVLLEIVARVGIRKTTGSWVWHEL